MTFVTPEDDFGMVNVVVWRALAETERQVRREHERLDEFSDPSAPSLKELQRKILAIERALEYMRKHGLDPVN